MEHPLLMAGFGVVCGIYWVYAAELSPLLIWRVGVAKAVAVMTVICGTVAAIVATIFLGQYLAWHGPEWMMMNRGANFGIGSIFAIIALIIGEFTIGSLLIGYIHDDKK